MRDKRTQYRVVSPPNATRFLAQYKLWWWPFWQTCSKNYANFSVPYYFDTYGDAEAWCHADAKARANEKKPPYIWYLGKLP